MELFEAHTRGLPKADIVQVPLLAWEKCFPLGESKPRSKRQESPGEGRLEGSRVHETGASTLEQQPPSPPGGEAACVAVSPSFGQEGTRQSDVFILQALVPWLRVTRMEGRGSRSQASGIGSRVIVDGCCISSGTVIKTRRAGL